MRYNIIVNEISKRLGDELVSESEMLSYMDSVIDDVNSRLNTVFPTFTEFKEQNAGVESTLLDYNLIPDKYIRTVIIPGSAYKYYVTDEEGSYAAPKYEEAYREGLFYMERDYSFNVPAKYRGDVVYGDPDNPESYASGEQGFLNTTMPGADPGLTVPRNGGFW